MHKVVVTSKKGGVSKTTTSLMVSCSLMRKGYRTSYHDMDRSQHSGEGVLARQKPETLGSYIQLPTGEDENTAFRIVDCAPDTSAPTIQAIESANVIIIPCTPNPLDISAMMGFLHAIVNLRKAANTPVKLLWTMVEKKNAQGKEAISDLAGKLQIEAFQTVITKRAKTAQAFGEDDFWGRCDKNNRIETDQLAEEILQMLNLPILET